MEYFLYGTVVMTIFIALSSLWGKRKKKKTIQEIRQAWGKEKAAFINFDKVKLYDDTITHHFFHDISDQTISDIDFYDLFAFIDRTTSTVGQQFLFYLLKKPTASLAALRKRNEQADFFSIQVDIREKIQVALKKLSKNYGYSIPLLLRDKLLERPKWYTWLFIDLVLLIACLTLSVKFPAFILFDLLIAGINVIYLSYLNKKFLFQFTSSLQQLNTLIEIAKQTVKLDIPFEKDEIDKGISTFRKFQQRINILYFGYDQQAEADISRLPVYLFELLKAVFLVDTFVLFRLLRMLENNQQHVLNLFEYLGNIDVAISIASLRAGELATCQPDFGKTGKVFAATNLKHPLIANCVGNSIAIENKSVLITGSNMSGKTTFLRTLAINALLAQTIYTCFADTYCAPMFKLHSSIRIDDNLFEGKSYFFEEVNVMRSLINEVNSGFQHLFILDEVFKGTNTIERIAAAKAILSYLNSNDHVVFVATHDTELVSLLRNEYELYHFTETIEVNQLIFDHKLKAGQLKTKNAIKILELSGYPKQITEEAAALSGVLSQPSV